MIELLPAALAFMGQEMTNSANAAIAQRQMDFQREMSDTAYQRQVADMKAAGLNPMLSYIKPSGASTPPGASYISQSPMSSAVDAYQRFSYSRKAQAETVTEGRRPDLVREQTGLTSRQATTEQMRPDLVLAQAAVERARLPLVEAETVLRKAETVLRKAQTNLSYSSAAQADQAVELMREQAREIGARIVNYDAMTAKIKEETKNLPLEGQRLVAAAAELTARVPLLEQQTLTEPDRRWQLTWLATKTMREADLLRYDIEAISNAGNFGKEFGQYGPGLKLLIDVFRALKR